MELTCTKHSAECHNQGIETNGSSEDPSSQSDSENDIDFKKSMFELVIHLRMILVLHNSNQ